MTDRTVTVILRQAAQAEGSTQALASRLHAPEPTLLRWMDGRAQTPLRAFLAVLEFLMQNERKGGEPVASSSTEQAPRLDKLVFSMGPLLARCSRCDATEFRLLSEGGLRLTSRLACTTCGQEALHGNLLAQLAKDVVHQSRALAVRTGRTISQSREASLRGRERVEESLRLVRPKRRRP